MKRRRLTFLAILVIFLLTLSLAGARYILGNWYPFMYIPLVMLITTGATVVYAHRSAVLAFLRHKSAKKSFSSGVLLVFVFSILLGVNYLTVKFPLSYDLTRTNRLSLSPESKQVVEKLRSFFIIRFIQNISLFTSTQRAL